MLKEAEVLPGDDELLDQGHGPSWLVRPDVLHVGPAQGEEDFDGTEVALQYPVHVLVERSGGVVA